MQNPAARQDGNNETSSTCFSADARIDSQASTTSKSGASRWTAARSNPAICSLRFPAAKTDGARFIDAAVSAGAVAIEGDHPPSGERAVPFIVTPNPRRALALAAANFSRASPQPSRPSPAPAARPPWPHSRGRSGGGSAIAAASIGTIGLVSPKRTIYGSLTTPDPVALHRQLDEIAQDGVRHLALEASSHGLDQYRLDGVRIAAGGFTNLSRDHMDYHPTSKHHLAAKLRLFRDLVPPGGAAVISADHEHSQGVIDAARERKLRTITVGHKGDGVGEGIRLVSAEIDGLAQKLSLEHRGRNYSVRLPLVGEFQVENALVATGLAIGTGSEPPAVFAALEHLEGAKGRLERSANTTAHRSSSTMPTSPTPWQKRCRRCGRMQSESWSWCSAPAATAMPASDR